MPQPVKAAGLSVLTLVNNNEFRVGSIVTALDYTTANQFASLNAQLGNKLGVLNANVTPNEQNPPIFSRSVYRGSARPPADFGAKYV